VFWRVCKKYNSRVKGRKAEISLMSANKRALGWPQAVANYTDTLCNDPRQPTLLLKNDIER
jgi:hypothetical protein